MCITQHTVRSHLSQDDRAVIEALRAQGATFRTIAECIHKHYSTISRELTRNCDAQGVYTARYAQKKSAARRLESRYGTRKIENDSELEQHKGWMTNIRSIETRPDEIQRRITVGHFEGDTIVLERGVRSIVTLVDRKSRFLIASLVCASTGISYDVHETLVAHLSQLPPHLRRTITPDRGSEFSYWDMTEQEVPGLTFYFAHARAPWERGTNEHANGLLRRYFPKGDKHATITEAQVTKVVRMINHRPRKSLNWKTPCQVFGGCCGSG
jgi:IS30 family transposase